MNILRTFCFVRPVCGLLGSIKPSLLGFLDCLDNVAQVSTVVQLWASQAFKLVIGYADCTTSCTENDLKS